MKQLIILLSVLLMVMFACDNITGPPPQKYTQEVTFKIIISENMDDLPNLRKAPGNPSAVTVWNTFHDTYTIEMLGTSWQGNMFDPNSEVLGHEVKHVLYMMDPLRIVTVHAP